MHVIEEITIISEGFNEEIISEMRGVIVSGGTEFNTVSSSSKIPPPSKVIVESSSGARVRLAGHLIRNDVADMSHVKGIAKTFKAVIINIKDDEGVLVKKSVNYSSLAKSLGLGSILGPLKILKFRLVDRLTGKNTLDSYINKKIYSIIDQRMFMCKTLFYDRAIKEIPDFSTYVAEYHLKVIEWFCRNMMNPPDLVGGFYERIAKEFSSEIDNKPDIKGHNFACQLLKSAQGLGLQPNPKNLFEALKTAGKTDEEIRKLAGELENQVKDVNLKAFFGQLGKVKS